MGHKPETPLPSKLAGTRRLVLVVVLACLGFLLLLLISKSGFRGHGVASTEASAVGSLRTINTAQITYAGTYKKGYSPSLKALGLPAGNSQPSASAAGLIDDLLASGKKSGYFFIYEPGPPDKAGHINTYTVVARPLEYGKTGTNSFFTDESGVLRQTSEDRPATAKDSPTVG